MKINNNNNNYQNYLNALKKTQTHKKAQNTKKNEQPQAVENRDQINISADAKKLAEISQKEQREARVEEIKAAVQNGSYEVKPKEITSSLINTINQQKGED